MIVTFWPLEGIAAGICIATQRQMVRALRATSSFLTFRRLSVFRLTSQGAHSNSLGLRLAFRRILCDSFEGQDSEPFSQKQGKADLAKCKLWRIVEEQVQLVQSITLASSATATYATEYHSRQAMTSGDLPIAHIRSRIYVAVGTEEGSITLFVLENGQLEHCMQVPDK
jgi:hypothetical protein